MATGPENQGLVQLVVYALPTVTAFAAGITFTKGPVRTAILCAFCALVGWTTSWIVEGESLQAFDARASACFHEQYLHSLKSR